MIHRIDSRFFVASDGRIIFRAGRQFVVIPEPDLGLVRRRNLQANAVGIAAVLVSNIGLPQAYWRPWWILMGVAAWVAAYLYVGRWVRERYGATTDPGVSRDLRQAVDRSGNPAAAGFQIASGALVLLSLGVSIMSKSPRSPSVLLLLVALTQVLGGFQRLRRAEPADVESYPGVTR